MNTKLIPHMSFWGVALLTGLIWTIGSATPSWADMSRYGHHRHPDASRFIWHLLQSKETLNLTPEQQTQLQAIAVNYKRDNVMRTAEVELAEIDMHQLLRNPTPASSSDVEAAVRKVHTLKADRQLASIKAFQEARAVLTPEQQQKLRDLRQPGHGGDRDRHAEGSSSSEGR